MKATLFTDGNDRVELATGGEGTVYLSVVREGGAGTQAILSPIDATLVGHTLIEYARKDRKAWQ